MFTLTETIKTSMSFQEPTKKQLHEIKAICKILNLSEPSVNTKLDAYYFINEYFEKAKRKYRELTKFQDYLFTKYFFGDETDLNGFDISEDIREY